jgi:hypothetical protein
MKESKGSLLCEILVVAFFWRRWMSEIRVEVRKSFVLRSNLATSILVAIQIKQYIAFAVEVTAKEKESFKSLCICQNQLKRAKNYKLLFLLLDSSIGYTTKAFTRCFFQMIANRLLLGL